MSALKKLLIVVAILVAIVAAIPLVLPYENYKADIEKAASSRLDTEVKIANIHFSYTPKPQLVLEKVSFGKADEGIVSRVIVPVTFKNLVNIRKELADVALEQGTLKQEFARSLPGRLKPDASGKDIYFAALRLSDFSIQLDKDSVGPFSGTLRFNSDGTFKVVSLSDKDGRANLTIKPTGDKFALDFDAKNWVLPGGNYPDARFDQLVLRGMADKDGITVDDVNGLIFGSAAVGQAKLSWSEGWRLSGSLQTKSMHVEPLISLVSPTTRSTGRMAASADFEFAGDTYESLFNQSRIALNFTVSDGNLHNLDLIAPLKSTNPSVLRRGGQTRFDTLRGEMLIENGVTTLRNLNLDSGKFTAAGNMGISADKKLSGKVSAKLSAGVATFSAPLTFGGTLEAPEIRSSGTYKPGGDDASTRIF